MAAHSIIITDHTTPEDMDNFFAHAWRPQKPVRLMIDTTQCRLITLRRAMRMKHVLEKHRAQSRRLVDESTILVSNRATKFVIQAALLLFRSENPVHVKVI